MVHVLNAVFFSFGSLLIGFMVPIFSRDNAILRGLLKKDHRTETEGCRKVILASARALDHIVEKYRNEIV
jgi:hypothetical protein